MFHSSRLMFVSVAIATVALGWPSQGLGKAKSKKDKGEKPDKSESAPAPASTESSGDRSEDLIRQGIDLRKSGNDDKALEMFRSAFQVRPTPRAQAQMGMAEQALGRWVDAEADLKAALRWSNDPWVSKNAKTLAGAVATVEQHLGSLQLLGTPAGAVVKIDEREVGKLPFDKPIRVTAGEVLVSISADGFFEINKRITVAAGRLAREAVALHPQPPAATTPVAAGGEARPKPSEDSVAAVEATATTNPSQPEAGEAQANEREMKPAPGSKRRFSTAQKWGIAFTVLGVAAAGVGGVFVAQAISKNNESSVGCMKDFCDAAGTDARLQALTAGNRATVAFAAAGVLVAGGVTLLIVGRHKGEVMQEATPTAWWIAPATDGERMALVGGARF